MQGCSPEQKEWRKGVNTRCELCDFWCIQNDSRCLRLARTEFEEGLAIFPPSECRSCGFGNIKRHAVLRDTNQKQIRPYRNWFRGFGNCNLYWRRALIDGFISLVQLPHFNHADRVQMPESTTLSSFYPYHISADQNVMIFSRWWTPLSKTIWIDVVIAMLLFTFMILYSNLTSARRVNSWFKSSST